MNFAAPQRSVNGDRQADAPQCRPPQRESPAESYTQAPQDPWTELATILLDMLEGPVGPIEQPGAIGGTFPEREPDREEEEPAAPLLSPEEDAIAEVTPPEAELPEDSAARLLQGETVEPEEPEVEVPEFPEGDTPLPEGAEITPPAVEEQAEGSAAGPQGGGEGSDGSGGGGGGSHRSIVNQWQQNVSRGAAGISTPPVEVPEAPRQALRRTAGAARTRQSNVRRGLTQDALNTVPPAPELDTTAPAPPPPNPVPDHTKKVLDTSGKKLPSQSSRGLRRSEKREIEGEEIGGHLPPLGVQPVAADLFQVLTTPGARSLGQLPGEAQEGQRETQEQRRIQQALEQLTESQEASERRGRGEQVISPDLGPTRATPISEQHQGHVKELVTRLLANPAATATDVLNRIRKNAYPDEVLMRTYPDAAAEMQEGLQTSLQAELRLIADAAGVSDEKLDALVADRRRELEQRQREASETVEAAGEEATETVRDEGQQTADAVEGAAEAAQDETLRRQTAIAGEADPAVINARRDRIVSWFREHITTQITNYQRAGDKRQTELTKARDDQLAGYRTLTQREVYRVLTPEGDRPPRDTSNTTRERTLSDEVALRRTWRDTQVSEVTEHFRKALSKASTTTRTNRTTIQNAGDAGIEAARRWAEDKILENESWWDRFVARVKRWLSEAKDVNENWRVRRGRENRDAITTDLDSVALAHTLLRQGADLNAMLAGNQLSDAQKDAIRAYFRQPRGTHPLDFAEMRLRQNLARDHQQDANRIIEQELLAKPVAYRDYTNANKLNDIARAQNSGFDATRITQELRGAMDQLGTDEARIYRNLSGLTAMQGAVVRKFYMARYGDNLDAELRSELSGEELQRAQAQIEGKQAQADAIALYDAMAGLGTDEAAIMQLLRNKSTAEREAIKAEYLRMYGRTLDEDLNDDLSDGNEIDQAQALLRGDTATADAIAIDEAMRGGFLGLGTSEGEITEVQERVRREVLAQAQRENWTSEQMEAEVRRRLDAIETQFGERYKNVEQYNAPGLGGGSVLERAFASELSREELDLANALQDNDLTRADAARIEIERMSFYASDEKINGVLRSQYERALQARRLDEGPARNMRVRREVARWEAEGKTPEEVSRLRMALERRMERELEDGAQRDSRISMEDLKNVYQDRYFWPLDFVIETNTSGEERNKARNMFEQGGRLTALQEVEYATRTAGTDEEALRRVLGRMTKEEIKLLEAQWEQRNPGRSFRAMLSSELSGRDHSDIMDMYEYGAPKSALEQIEQERRRVDREVNELTGVLGGAAAGAEADWMRAEYARLNELRDDLTHTYPNTEEGRRKRARLSSEFDNRVQRVQGAVEDHRRRIDSVTDTATQVVGIVVAVVVATVVTIATAGTAAPGVIAAIAAVSASVAATAATMATKQLIKGGAYGIEEVGVDIAVGVVDALTAAVTAGMGSKLLGPLRSLASGTKLPALAGRLGQTGFAQRLAATQGRGGLARIARNIAPTREGVERAMAGFLAEGVEDAVSSLPSAMVQIALTDTTWQGDPLKNFLEGGGMAIVQSVAMGRTLGAGMSAAGGLRNFGRGLIRGGSDMGRLLELNQLISDGYGAFRQDNPGATIDAFMASPQGRRVAFEIEQRGLMADLRNVNRAVEADAPSPAARAQADENAVNTHLGADPEPVRPPEIDAEARAETLRQTLPDSLQDGTFVTPDPDLSGRTVKVEPLRIGKEIVGVDIRVGPDATPLDVAMHAATVQAMHKYRGLLGQVRRAWHDLMARATRSGWTVGSKAWEAQMEVAKLPAILYERMDALAMSGGTLTPGQRMRLELDAMSLAAQFHAHEAVMNHPTAGGESGRGFVAAEEDVGLLPPRREPAEVLGMLSAKERSGLERLAEIILAPNSKVPKRVFLRRLAKIAKDHGIRFTDLDQAISSLPPEHSARKLNEQLYEQTVPQGRVESYIDLAKAVGDVDAYKRAVEREIDAITQPPRAPERTIDEDPFAHAVYEYELNLYNLLRESNQALRELMSLMESGFDAHTTAEIREAWARADEAKARLEEARVLPRPDGPPVRPTEVDSGRHPTARGEARRARGEMKTKAGEKFEGMADLALLKENIEAIEVIQRVIQEFSPDLVLGVERGGGFMVEVVGDGVFTARRRKGGEKNDERAPHLVRAIEEAIARGERKFVIVDVYMGGGAINDFRRNVIEVILDRHPGITDIELKTVWLREEHGFERLRADPVYEKVSPLLPHTDETGVPRPEAAPEAVTRLREAAGEGLVPLRQELERLRRQEFGTAEDAAPLLTVPEIVRLRDILLGDPTDRPHMLDGGLEAVSNFDSTVLKEGENYSHEIIPVRYVVGDDMKMVLEPGTSTGPIVIVNRHNGKFIAIPVHTVDPITGQMLRTQREIMLAILKGHFQGWLDTLE